MQYALKTTYVELSSTTRGYLDKKMNSLGKLLDASAGNIRADVEVGKTTRHHATGNLFLAEINVHIGRTLLRARAEAANLHAAIDIAQEEMTNELRRFRERHVARERKGKRELKERVREV